MSSAIFWQKYPDNKRLQNVLLYDAKWHQGVLKLPYNPRKAYKYAKSEMRNYSCILYVNQYSDKIYELFLIYRKLDKIILNTSERKKIFKRKNELFRGVYIVTPTSQINEINCKKWYDLEMEDDE